MAQPFPAPVRAACWPAASLLARVACWPAAALLAHAAGLTCGLLITVAPGGCGNGLPAPSGTEALLANLVQVQGQVAFERSEYLTPWHGLSPEQLRSPPPGVLSDERPVIAGAAPHHFEWHLAEASATDAGPRHRILRGAVRRSSSHPEFALHCELFWTSDGGQPRSLWSRVLPPAPDQISEAWSEIKIEIPVAVGRLDFVARGAAPGVVHERLGRVAWALPTWFVDDPPPPTGADSLQPDVLLLTIDTMRADALDHAPGLRAAFSSGTLWNQAVSPSNWTLPAYASLFTGVRADRHGAGRGPFSAQASGNAEDRSLSALDPQLRTLAERFRAAGYRSAMFHQNPMLESWTGLSRGFDRYVRCGPDTAAVLQQAGLWWQSEAARPRFLVVHMMAPHLPYRVGPDPDPLADRAFTDFFLADHTSQQRAAFFDLAEAQRTRVRSRYAAEVARLDGQLAPWLAELQTMGPRSLIYALHSDHGEELWDQGSFEHGHSFIDAVVRVPLAMVAPGVPPAVSNQIVPAHGLGASLLEAAGISHDLPFSLAAPPPAFASLMPLYRAQFGGRRFDAEGSRDMPFDPQLGAGGRAAEISLEKLRQLQELGYLAAQDSH